MTKLFCSLALLLTGLLAVSTLAGCGDVNDDDSDIPVPPMPSVTPPSGTTISANETIRVRFDYKPADVTVSLGTIKVDGKTATITGPFHLGALTLMIAWADGTTVLNYTVTAPD